VDLQRALKKNNFHPGSIDGVYGYQTRKAVIAYQKSKHIASGGLTKETLDKLGVSVNKFSRN